MSRTGRIPSIGHGSKANLLYHTTLGTIEYDYSHLLDKDRYLEDEKFELAGHFGGQYDSHAKDAAIFRPGQDGVAQRDVPKVEVGPVTKNRPRRIEDPEEEEEDQDDSLGMEDMMRIKVRKTYREDDGFDSMNSWLLPVLLTSREGTVEMGWRV